MRKSILTNLTDNKRRSNSALPRVHSDWPLYDIGGQSGHIHELTLSYINNLAPGLYGRAHAGLLEPFFGVWRRIDLQASAVAHRNRNGCPSCAKERLRHAF